MAAEGWTEQGCPYPPLWDLGLLSLQPVASVNIWDCAPWKACGVRALTGLKAPCNRDSGFLEGRSECSLSQVPWRQRPHGPKAPPPPFCSAQRFPPLFNPTPGFLHPSSVLPSTSDSQALTYVPQPDPTATACPSRRQHLATAQHLLTHLLALG